MTHSVSHLPPTVGLLCPQQKSTNAKMKEQIIKRSTVTIKNVSVYLQFTFPMSLVETPELYCITREQNVMVFLLKVNSDNNAFISSKSNSALTPHFLPLCHNYNVHTMQSLWVCDVMLLYQQPPFLLGGGKVIYFLLICVFF